MPFSSHHFFFCNNLPRLLEIEEKEICNSFELLDSNICCRNAEFREKKYLMSKDGLLILFVSA
jgi:hypothetical protein